MSTILPNSISVTLVSSDWQWLLLGTYLSPNEPPDLELTALEAEYQQNSRLPVILLGDLNVNFDNMNSKHSIAIAMTLQHLGTIDSFIKFPQNINDTLLNTRPFTTRCSNAAAVTMPWQTLELTSSCYD